MKFILIIIFLFTYSLYAQNTLILQYPKYKGELFYQIKPVNLDTAIAIMNDGSFGLSTNKGYDWRKIRIDSMEVKAIGADEKMNVYAATGNTSKMRFYRTTDFGSSWIYNSEINYGTFLPFLFEFEFFSPDTGYFYIGLMGFTKSTAKAWRTISRLDPNDMQFKGRFGWMLYDSRIYRSEDFGHSWRPFYQGVAKFNLIDSMVGFYQANSKTFKTADGGKSWQSIPGSDGGSTNFVTRDVGVFNKNPESFLTTNSGSSWTKVGENVPLSFLNGDIGYGWDNFGLLTRITNNGKTIDTISTRISLIAHCGQIHILPNGVGVAAKGNFGRQNIFLNTTNFGDEWYPVSKSQSEIPYLFNFSSDYFAYGIGVDSSRNTYTIVQTTDGGLHWQYHSDLYAFNKYKPKNKPTMIQTVSENIIAVTADTLLLFFSNNKGATWRVHNFRNEVGTEYSFIQSAFFVDSIHGFVSTTNNSFRTTDGGVTWQLVPYHTGGDPSIINGLYDLYFQNITTGYACTSNIVYGTKDGGISWKKVIESPTANSRKLHFRDEKHGVFFLYGATQSMSHAYITNDSGKSWKEYSFFGGEDFQDVSLLNDTTFWIGDIPGGVFYDAYQYPGYIKRAIVRKQTTSIKRQNNPIIPKLLSVYPNPLRSDQALTIPLEADEEMDLKIDALSVYDVLGRRMQIDPVLIRSGGESHFIVQGKSFIPGVYFFRIIVNEESHNREYNRSGKMFSGKFIIVR